MNKKIIVAMTVPGQDTVLHEGTSLLAVCGREGSEYSATFSGTGEDAIRSLASAMGLIRRRLGPEIIAAAIALAGDSSAQKVTESGSGSLGPSRVGSAGSHVQ